jgi:hypothetical protein
MRECSTCGAPNLRSGGHADWCERVAAANRADATRALKTRCIRGHPFDAANTYHRPNGYRECLACRRVRRAA